VTPPRAQQAARSWRWLARVPAWAWDVIPVAFLGLTLLAFAFRPAAEAGLALSAGAVATLLVRRRAPRTVLAVTGACAFIGIVYGTQSHPAAISATVVALYTVDTRCSRRWSLGFSAIALAAAVTALTLAADSVKSGGTLAFPAGVLILALWVIGDNVRVRRAYVAGLEERAVWVDAQRAAEARRAAGAERARIARELHDVVAHHVAVMAVQAGAARMLNESLDQQTRDLLTSIEDSAHQAMSELRRLLGVLRRDDSSAAAEPPSAPAPQPGLGQLGQLVEQVRQAGLPVHLTEAGGAGELPDSVDLSAYRIVQEALTNVLKHAGPVPTTVCVRRTRGEVTLVVTNRPPAAVLTGATAPGPSGPSDRPGHGLIGMRERAGMAGGELRAGPTADGGFQVLARLPAGPRAALPAGRP
jgi:signal transduction histidine kinase